MRAENLERSAAPSDKRTILAALARRFARRSESQKVISFHVRRSRRPLGCVAVLALTILLAISGIARADGIILTIPDGVPDLHDPQVLAKYVPVQVGTIGGNPDLPMVMLVSRDEQSPEMLLVGLDARNGKETWSMLSDPIVLVAMFESPTTIRQLDIDPGFLSQGEASGSFERVPNPRLETLPDLLRSIALIPERIFL